MQRLSTSFGEQEMQPVCPPCHAHKTANEPHELEHDPIASHFERRVWEAYVLSPRPPPLVWKAKPLEDVTGCRIADVRRCRKRALEFNTHEIPVFSPLDDTQPTGHTLGDIVFASKPSKCFIADLGYTGPGWMHRVQAEWLLHMGVLTWADLLGSSRPQGACPRTSSARRSREWRPRGARAGWPSRR